MRKLLASKNRGSVLSWIMYDWANSGYATTVMVGFFPLFFKEYWGGELGSIESTFFLGLGNSAASLVVVFCAPLLGAIADKGAYKKRFLVFFTFLGILMTGGMWFIDHGQWAIAILFYTLGTVGFSSGVTFYDSLLVSIAPRKKVDLVSSLGFSAGYLGGGLLFLLNVLIYLNPEWVGTTNPAVAVKVIFVTVAIWWAIFTVPLILFVKEPNLEARRKGAATAGWKQLMNTFREIRNLKDIKLFLIAYWLYMDGVDTVLRMAVDYGSALGFPSTSLIVALLITQFVAFPAVLAYNWFASKIGVGRSLLIAIGAFGIVTVFGYFMTHVWQFYLLALLVGLFQGGIQALSRSYYVRLIPRHRAGEFFGFFNVMGKFAAVLGPLLLGGTVLLTRNNRAGVLVIAALLLPGGYLLSLLDKRRKEALDEDLIADEESPA